MCLSPAVPAFRSTRNTQVLSIKSASKVWEGMHEPDRRKHCSGDADWFRGVQ